MTLNFDPDNDQEREAYWVTRRFAADKARESWWMGFCAASGLMLLLGLFATWTLS